MAPPTLQDLKGCGAIEEESAFVAIMKTDGMYTDENVLTVTLELAKNRFGPTGQMDLSFDKNYTKFVEV